MTLADLDRRWIEFRNRVYNPGMPAEQENERKMCFVAGMMEMYGFVTDEIAEQAKDNDNIGMHLLNQTLRTLDATCADLVRKSFELRGEDGASH